MDRFLQLHLLTSYPPSNPNRDDLNRPKTAVVGGATRLRISSQSLKRAWRTSDAFREALGAGDVELSDAFRKALLQGDLTENHLHAHLGIRTKDLGIAVYRTLTDGHGAEPKDARAWTKAVAESFATLSSPNDAVLKKNPLADLQTGQLVLYSMEEMKAVDALVTKLGQEKQAPTDDDLKLLRDHHAAADLALFGRMLADKPKYREEAAAQVAHAFTVNAVEVEDDYFTAVDSLNLSPREDAEDEDRGAAHIGELEFGSGVFYTYVCVDIQSLRENLSVDGNPGDLPDRTLRALVHAALTTTPSGKRNSFGHHTYAHLALAERGSQQPRSLAVAFLDPVRARPGQSTLDEAHDRLRDAWERMDDVYGACASARYILDARPSADRDGTLGGMLAFVTGGAGNAEREGKNANGAAS